jgi:hypothetical protein
MNIVFADSCRHYPTAGLAYKYTYNGDGVLVAADNGRSNGPSIRCFPNNTELLHYFKRILSNSHSELGVAFRYKQATNFTGGGIIISIWDGSTEQCAIGCDTSGHLIAYKNDNSTVLETSANTLSLDTLYHIEAHFVINNSAGSIKVKVNGNSAGWIDLTNVDTQASSNSTCNVFMFSNAKSVSGGSRYICDIACNADTDFIGEASVSPTLVNAAGTNAEWTASAGSNYTCVDESSASETDNVSTSTDSVKDSYNFESVASNATILAAVHTMIAKKEDAGSAYIKPLCISNSVEYLQASIPVPAAYSAIQAIYQLDPNTSAMWVNSAFNAAEFGQKYSLT